VADLFAGSRGFVRPNSPQGAADYDATVGSPPVVPVKAPAATGFTGAGLSAIGTVTPDQAAKLRGLLAAQGRSATEIETILSAYKPR